MAGRLRFGTVDQRAPRGRPKRWRARYDDPTWDGEGRPPRITAPETFPTRAAAEAWLNRVWASVADGTWIHPDAQRRLDEEAERERSLRALTVADWAGTWLDEVRATRAAGTLRKRRSDLRVHVLPALGTVRLVDLSPTRVQSWYTALPSAGTRTSAYQTLRAMLQAAVDSPDTLLDTNPCRIRGASRSRSGALGERYLFTAEEVEAVAAAVAPRWRALVVLLADSGLRVNEALALHRDDVHLGADGAFVDVGHSLVRDGRSLRRGPTKTRRSRRVQVTPSTAQVLADHLERFSGPVVVFPSVAGVYARDTTATKALGAAMAAAGVVVPEGRYAGWHAFRHYAATRYGQAGASTAAIMTRFGWVRPEQAAHYQRQDADYERMILDRMAAQAGQRTWAEAAEALGPVVPLRRRA